MSPPPKDRASSRVPSHLVDKTRLIPKAMASSALFSSLFSVARSRVRERIVSSCHRVLANNPRKTKTKHPTKKNTTPIQLSRLNPPLPRDVLSGTPMDSLSYLYWVVFFSFLTFRDGLRFFLLFFLRPFVCTHPLEWATLPTASHFLDFLSPDPSPLQPGCLPVASSLSRRFFVLLSSYAFHHLQRFFWIWSGTPGGLHSCTSLRCLDLHEELFPVREEIVNLFKRTIRTISVPTFLLPFSPSILLVCFYRLRLP